MEKTFKKILIGDNILSQKYMDKYTSSNDLVKKQIDLSIDDLNKSSFDIFSGNLFDVRYLLIIKGFSLKKEHTEFILKYAEGFNDIVIWDNTCAIKKTKNKFSVKTQNFIDNLKAIGFDLIDNNINLKSDAISISFLQEYAKSCNSSVTEKACKLLIDYGNGSKSYCMGEIDKISICLDRINSGAIKQFCYPLKNNIELYELSNAMDAYDLDRSLAIANELMIAGQHEFVLLEVIYKKFKWRTLAFEFYFKKNNSIANSLFLFGKIKEVDEKMMKKWRLLEKTTELNKTDNIPLIFMAKGIEDALTFNICNRIKNEDDCLKMRDYLLNSYCKCISKYRECRMNISKDIIFSMIYEYFSAKEFANSF